MEERTCETCCWWDNGFCDRVGKTCREEDSCPKWRESGENDDGK